MFEIGAIVKKKLLSYMDEIDEIKTKYNISNKKVFKDEQTND